MNTSAQSTGNASSGNAPQGDDSFLLREDRDGITTLTLNRPAQYNCLSEGMLQALTDALAALAEDPQVRLVVLAAAGKAFCAGHDLKEMRARSDQAYHQELFQRCAGVMQQIVNLPMPVIARVQGTATAAGCQLVATCDLAVASTEARFAVSGVRLGLFCSTPSVALSRNVARKQAFEMLVTGDFIDAQTAVARGLVNYAVEPGELDDKLGELCAHIMRNPASAIAIGKGMFYRQLERNLDDAYVYAGDVMACNMGEPDAIEGIDAFIEKRDPKWPTG